MPGRAWSVYTWCFVGLKGGAGLSLEVGFCLFPRRLLDLLVQGNLPALFIQVLHRKQYGLIDPKDLMYLKMMICKICSIVYGRNNITLVGSTTFTKGEGSLLWSPPSAAHRIDASTKMPGLQIPCIYLSVWLSICWFKFYLRRNSQKLHKTRFVCQLSQRGLFQTNTIKKLAEFSEKGRAKVGWPTII